MAAHARFKNEFTEDEKYHNLMTWLKWSIIHLPGSHIDETYWLVGSDIIAEKDWRWMLGDGVSRPITNYTNWGSHRPDNTGGNENCLVIVYHHGNTYWDDRNCQEQHSFVCSKK